MCDAAGSDAEYAGMAVYTPHGGRGRSVAGHREKSAHGRQERIPQRLSSTPLDTRMGTMYLMVPKVRQGGYIPFFVTERKRSEAMLVQVVQEAFVQGVSTRKMEKLAHSLGIENLSRSQVSEMTKGLNEQVEEFRNRSLADTVYPVLWVDALYEKVRVDGRIVSIAVLIVCGVDDNRCGSRFCRPCAGSSLLPAADRPLPPSALCTAIPEYSASDPAASYNAVAILSDL